MRSIFVAKHSKESLYAHFTHIKLNHTSRAIPWWEDVEIALLDYYKLILH
jgi:hypothetical protein